MPKQEVSGQGSPLVLFPLAAVITTTLLYFPGLLLRGFVFYDVSSETFWLFYLIGWGVALALGVFYRPKEEYDLGIRAGPFLIDRPWSLRDNYHRAHFVFGLILFPITLVVGAWVAAFRSLGPK